MIDTEVVPFIFMIVMGPAVKEFQEAERKKADMAKRDYHEKLENQERELLKKLLDKYGHDVSTGK